MIFVDTSIFIAAARQEDPAHASAEALLRKMAVEGQTVLTTDHVVDETLTYLKRKGGKHVAFDAGQCLLKSPEVQLEYGTPSRTQEALELLGKIDGLSFCDALNVVVMKELGVQTIYSLDADFDKIKGIRRIE